MESLSFFYILNCSRKMRKLGRSQDLLEKKFFFLLRFNLKQPNTTSSLPEVCIHSNNNNTLSDERCAHLPTMRSKRRIHWVECKQIDFWTWDPFPCFSPSIFCFPFSSHSFFSKSSLASLLSQARMLNQLNHHAYFKTYGVDRHRH